MSRHFWGLLGAALVSVVAAGVLVGCTAERTPVVPTATATASPLVSLFEDAQQPDDQLPEDATANTVEQVDVSSTRLLTTVGGQSFFAARPVSDSDGICLVIVDGIQASSACGGEPVGLQLQGNPQYSLSGSKPSLGSNWTEISTYLWQSG